VSHLLIPLASLLSGVGLLVVGLFDSLLDMPRVAFLFYLLVALAWILPAPTTTARKASPPPA
jgi:hypothetical protein